jgi:hypothetical protein
MSYEYYLRRSDGSWRPEYVRDRKNFANVIANYRNRYSKAASGSAAERKIVANFNKAYSAWVEKVKNENERRRASERTFFNNIRAAKKSGNAAAVNAVLARYANAGGSSARSLAAAARQRVPVARKPSPSRSGKQRNSVNFRKAMAQRNLYQLKRNLMTEKAALEYERNKLETKIFTIIRKLGELPNL